MIDERKEISNDLVGTTFEPVDISWSNADTRLYALAVGALPETDLDYIYEGKGPKVLPTYPVAKVLEILGTAFMGVKIDLLSVLHGEQSITLHRPLPADFKGKATTRISQVWDKEKAAVIGVEGVVSDDKGPLATLESTIFIRGAGSFGGDRGPSSAESKITPPDREPDYVESYTTHLNQAALYRLCGDPNPIHIDPDFAKMAGFSGPFLHGLCTYGISGRAITNGLCGGDSSRFVSMTGRFNKQVWMEDVVTTKIWDLGDGKAVVEAYTQDGECVLSQCKVEYKPA